MPLSSRGGGGDGGKALMAWPLVEELFFSASLNNIYFHLSKLNICFLEFLKADSLLFLQSQVQSNKHFHKDMIDNSTAYFNIAYRY